MSENPAPAVDVKALLDQVEEQLAQARASGQIDPAEEERVAASQVTLVVAAEDGGEAELNLILGRVRQLWNAKACGVATHRAGLAGKLIHKAKRLLHKVSSFPLGVWLAQQVLFNDEVVRFLNHLLPQHLDLRHRVTHNEKRLDSLEDHGRQVDGQLSGLPQRVELVANRQHELTKLQDELRVRQDEFAARQTDFGVRQDDFRVLVANEREHWLRLLSEERRQNNSRFSSLERELFKGPARMETALAGIQDLLHEQGATPQALSEVAAQRARNRGGGYLDFEELHRGDPREIQKRQEVYLPYFRESVSEKAPLLDVGCGRGEFLLAAREAGLPARGLDLNPETVAYCQKEGLDVTEADGISYLRGLPDASLGGILMAQVIEHLTVDQLTEMVSLASAKLIPGGVLIAETVNPASLSTFGSAFYLDLTHIKPIHPEAARFLWRWAGLGEVDIILLSQVEADHKLELLPSAADEVQEAFNRNMQRLNQLLYGPQDYAVVGHK